MKDLKSLNGKSKPLANLSDYHQLIFEGIGTHWKVLYFHNSQTNPRFNPELVKEKILKLVNEFDAQYSRFKSTSLVSKIYHTKDFHGTISAEFTEILAFGEKLKHLSKGYFNPTVGVKLNSLGYDQNYSFLPQSNNGKSTYWNLNGNQLKTKGNVLLDIGAWGKGYLIDLIAKTLKSWGFSHFLIDGGGDIYATTKVDDAPWHVGIEHPQDSQLVIGVLNLQNQALASSSGLRRRFGLHHHLLNAHSGQSVNDVASVHVLASTAMLADGLATAWFVTPNHLKDRLSQAFTFEYLQIHPDLTLVKSYGFKADIFTNSNIKKNRL